MLPAKTASLFAVSFFQLWEVLKRANVLSLSLREKVQLSRRHAFAASPNHKSPGSEMDARYHPAIACKLFFFPQGRFMCFVFCFTRDFIFFTSLFLGERFSFRVILSTYGCHSSHSTLCQRAVWIYFCRTKSKSSGTLPLCTRTALLLLVLILRVKPNAFISACVMRCCLFFFFSPSPTLSLFVLAQNLQAVVSEVSDQCLPVGSSRVHPAQSVHNKVKEQ